MAIELKERLSKEPLIIGIIGPTGAGKSTLSKILGEKLGVPVIEENYPQNPFLERFYQEPKLWSYKSQTWFFAEKIKQLRDLDFTKSQIIDPALEMDYIYAQTLHNINFMETREFELYKTTFKDVYEFLQEEKGIRKPDIFLVVNAFPDTLEKRIRRRARPYEMIMLNKYPSYLSNLWRSVEIFSDRKSIYVDTRDDGYTNETQINNLIGKINNIL